MCMHEATISEAHAQQVCTETHTHSYQYTHTRTCATMHTKIRLKHECIIRFVSCGFASGCVLTTSVHTQTHTNALRHTHKLTLTKRHAEKGNEHTEQGTKVK